ncbi:MAG: hypothetical protein HOW97_11405, partial [Catenulispora sp.]|nr:hypothetical protein [Catenulispora sp.]
DAVSGAAQTDSPVIQATAALDRTAVLELAGRPGEAAAAAEAARGLYAAKGHVPGTRRAQVHQARLLAAHGAVRTGRD